MNYSLLFQIVPVVEGEVEIGEIIISYNRVGYSIANDFLFKAQKFKLIKAPIKVEYYIQSQT